MIDFEALWAQHGRCAYAKHNGYTMEVLEPDRAVMRLEIRPESCNPYGVVHGGLLYSIADEATGMAVHTDGRCYVTQNGNLHFLKNQPTGVLRAQARVRRRGKATVLLDVDITNERGDLMATGQFVYFCIAQSPEELAAKQAKR